MKHRKALITFYLLSAFATHCRAQVSGSPESASRQSAAESPAVSNRVQQCAVAGSVVSATTGEPIHKASVRLSRLAEGSGAAIRGTYGATTNASGNFQARVEAGRYTMAVTRNGYAQQTAGQMGSAKAASIITLACGADMAGIRFLMTPQGLITGRVVDEDNEPVANAIVEAFNDRAVLPPSRIRTAGSARTDDLGKYRIFGLAAGRYFVRAQLQEEYVTLATPEKQQTSYVPIYYPGTNHAAAATPIPVTSGQESEANIAISKVPTVHISGNVRTDYQIGGPPRLIAYPGDHPSWDPGERRGVIAEDKTGRWGLDGLQPGPYTLVSDRIDRGVRLGARQVVNVGTKNIDNIEVTLNRYPDLAGKVTVEGGGKVPSGIRVALQPRQVVASMGYAGAPVSPEGEFLMTAISPDLSDIWVPNLPAGYFVKSVIFSGREVSESGIELGLGGGSHQVNIVISPNGATLEGSVSEEEGRPSPGATVVLVPDLEHRQLKFRYYTATADQNGRFTASGIHPGEYTVVAWDSAEALDNAAADALEIADKQGQTLKLEGGGRKAAQLKAFSSSALLP